MPRGMACHALLTSAWRRLRLPECAGRASCRARRRSIARQIGKREIRTPDWKCNRSRLKVKWRRALLAETRRKGVRYGMVVRIFHECGQNSCQFVKIRGQPAEVCPHVISAQALLPCQAPADGNQEFTDKRPWTADKGLFDLEWQGGEWNVNLHAPPPTPTSNSSKHLQPVAYKMRIQCGILFRLPSSRIPLHSRNARLPLSWPVPKATPCAVPLHSTESHSRSPKRTFRPPNE